MTETLETAGASVKNPWQNLDNPDQTRAINDAAIRWIVESSPLPVALPLLIWRMTVGFDRDAWTTTISQIARMCGRSRPKVSQAIVADPLIVAEQVGGRTRLALAAGAPLANCSLRVTPHAKLLPLGNTSEPGKLFPKGNTPRQTVTLGEHLAAPQTVTLGEHPEAKLLPLGNTLSPQNGQTVTLGEHKRRTSSSLDQEQETTTTIGEEDRARDFPEHLIPKAVGEGRVKRTSVPCMSLEQFEARWRDAIGADWIRASDSRQWQRHAAPWIAAMLYYLTVAEVDELIDAALGATGTPTLKFYVAVADRRFDARTGFKPMRRLSNRTTTTPQPSPYTPRGTADAEGQFAPSEALAAPPRLPNTTNTNAIGGPNPHETPA